MSAETSVPVSQEIEDDKRLVYDVSNVFERNLSDDTLVDSEEFASAVALQEKTDKTQKKSAEETNVMPELSLIGSEVFDEPMPTGSLIGSNKSTVSTDEANQTAESSMFDNDSNVMIRKKKSTKLDLDYMRKIQEGFSAGETPSERPVRD